MLLLTFQKDEKLASGVLKHIMNIFVGSECEQRWYDINKKKSGPCQVS